MKHEFICAAYLENDKSVYHREVCNSASEALEKANKWREQGYKAQAYLHAIDTETYEIYVFPLN